jgi:hypothetical protein
MFLSVAVFLAVATLFTCIDLENNPIDPEYPGDYSLKIGFDKLADTLSLFGSTLLHGKTWKGFDLSYRTFHRPGGKSYFTCG